MKRRSFLKGLFGIGAGVVAAPVLANSNTHQVHTDLANGKDETNIKMDVKPNEDIVLNGNITVTGNIATATTMPGYYHLYDINGTEQWVKFQ